MNHNIIKSVIFDRHEVIKKFSIIKREYSFDLNLNYVVVGLRRAGKTFLLYSVVQDLINSGVDWNQIIYINFEDERLTDFNINDFNDIVLVKNELNDKKVYYFFDEIQNIEGWEKFVRRLADEKEFVYVTGSNAKMLSSDISNTLGARFVPKYVSTLSFNEYLNALNIEHGNNALHTTSKKGKIIRYFDDYYRFGGFPETLDIEIKREYVSNIYQKIILGDVASRNKIRNEYALRILVKKIAESVKADISYTRLHNTLKSIGVSISVDTLIEYIAYFNEAYLLFNIKNYFAKFVEKESNPKYYFNDNGLLNLFLYNEDSSLLENIIAVYLHNRYNDQLYYLKSAQFSIDIDFFIPDDNIAVQVAYSISGEARKREINNLIKYAKTNMDCRLIIVTHNEEELIEADGFNIEAIPAYKFILEDL